MSLWQNIKKKSKSYFLSGILFFVPLVITIVVIKAIFTFLDNLLFPYLQPYFGYWLPGIGILIILGMILLTGMLVTNYMGRKFFQFGEKMVLHIPLVKSIYGSVKQILQTFSGQEKQVNKKVVLVEYPRENVWSVGLVNGELAASADPGGAVQYPDYRRHQSRLRLFHYGAKRKSYST